MPNYGALSGGLDAVRDAIAFYMDLRGQKQQREREVESDSRADRQLRMLEDRERTNREDKTTDNERAALQFMMTNHGGASIGQPDVDRMRKYGYGGAVEEEMTLPSRTIGMDVTSAPPAYQQTGDAQMTPQMPADVPSPMQTIEQYSPAQGTGSYHIRQPESEKSQIAYYQAQAAAVRNNATIDSREREGAANRAVRQAAIRASLTNAASARELQRYGIDVRDASTRMMIEQRVLDGMNSADNMAFDNLMAGGPMALLRFLGADGIKLPTPPQPHMPAAAPYAGGSADSDWEPIP